METTPQANKIDKSKIADTKILKRENPETEITLSIPGVEYQNEIDIVFAMDSSSSAQNSEVFKESVTSLFKSILENNPNVKLKVGVIRFRGRAHDAIKYLAAKDGKDYQELTVYDADSKTYIESALTMEENEIKAAFGNGSNTHGGIDIANEWLEADSDLDDDHKYLVLLTDGKTYIWNNEKNEPTSIYTQYFSNKGYTIQNGGIPDVNQSAGYNKTSYQVDVLDPKGKSNVVGFTDYQKLYESTNSELTGVGPWDAYCKYADDGSKPTGTVEKHDVTNGAELFGSTQKDLQCYWEYIPDSGWKDLLYQEANPYVVVKNEDGKYTFDTERINPNYYLYHVDCLQKGMYKAGHLWADVNKKYNCAAITYSGGGATGFVELRKSFISWLQNNSKYAADIKATPKVEEMFQGIDNDIRYLIGKGVVTDEITSPFNLKMDGYGENLPFKLMVGEEEYEATAGENNTWVFNKKTTSSEGNETEEPGDDNTGAGDSAQTPPYSVSWNKATNTFTWNINVPVENANKLKLRYKLEWRTEGENTGKPGEWTNTNGTTELTYWKSTNTTETADGTESFDSPKVIYPLQVTYKANYEGGGNDIVDKGESTEKGYYAKNDKVELEGSNAFTRSGYTFSGWSTSPDGEVLPDEPYDLTADTTFYAIWTQNPTPPRPPVDIDDPDVPLDLNGADHFAYIEGYPDGTVQPGGNITRAEVSTMIYRLLTEDRRAEIFTDQNDYSDVEKPNWFNKAVSSMTVGKYVTGYPDGTFLPNQAITRAEFVTIVVRFLDGMKASENPFSDIDGHWAKDYILSAVDAGWIDGYPDGTFQPDKAITRAEAMKIMNMILHRGVNETSELGEPVMFPDNSDAGQWYYYEVIEATNDHETEGERPDEQWKSNTIDYTYDIVKYERP